MPKNKYNEFEYWNQRNNPTAKGMPPHTTQAHIDYIKKHVNGLTRILDFGPGIGRTLNAYDGVKEVIGWDISTAYRERVLQEASLHPFAFTLVHTSSPVKLPFMDKVFDAAVACEVLLHQRPQNIIRIMTELIRVAHKAIIITWMDDSKLFKTPGAKEQGPDYCFNYRYLKICEEQGWDVSDVQTRKNQIFFVYQER